jgi:hypothetical protein
LHEQKAILRYFLKEKAVETWRPPSKTKKGEGKTLARGTERQVTASALPSKP